MSLDNRQNKGFNFLLSGFTSSFLNPDTHFLLLLLILADKKEKYEGFLMMQRKVTVYRAEK